MNVPNNVFDQAETRNITVNVIKIVIITSTITMVIDDSVEVKVTAS